MKSLQIMNILKNDSFTKTVFTDVLPSDRLPNEIRKRPRGYIYLTRILPINLDRIGWQCTLQKMTKGNLGFLWSGSWILQSELYSIFGQALQYIYVDNHPFSIHLNGYYPYVLN